MTEDIPLEITSSDMANLPIFIAVLIVATVVVLLCWPLLRRGGRVVLLVVAATFVLSVCLDRVFLGVHYPSDVTAGVLLGCGLVLASWLGLLGWQPPDHPLHDSLHPHRKEAP